MLILLGQARRAFIINEHYAKFMFMSTFINGSHQYVVDKRQLECLFDSICTRHIVNMFGTHVKVRKYIMSKKNWSQNDMWFEQQFL